MKTCCVALLLGICLLAPACGSGGIGDFLPVATYGATLSASNEVPAVVSLANGTAVMTYNKLNNTFDVVVTVAGIAASNVVGWHIHLAPAGLNGPIIVDLSGSGFVDLGGGTMRAEALGVLFPAATVSELESGGCYLNVHTFANPAGEVRGQLDPVL